MPNTLKVTFGGITQFDPDGFVLCPNCESLNGQHTVIAQSDCSYIFNQECDEVGEIGYQINVVFAYNPADEDCTPSTPYSILVTLEVYNSTQAHPGCEGCLGIPGEPAPLENCSPLTGRYTPIIRWKTCSATPFNCMQLNMGVGYLDDNRNFCGEGCASGTCTVSVS